MPATTPDQTYSLAAQFLIAMPNMLDPNFAGSLVFLCEHNERGAMGLMVNRPTELTLDALYEKIEIELMREPVAGQPVFFGGPVQTERGFVLHEPVDDSTYSSTVSIGSTLRLTTSKDVLEEMSHGAGPQRVLVTLGYAGWSTGQLENEIASNGWLTLEASPEVAATLIFDTPVEQRYAAAIKQLGFDPVMLTGEAGHA
ncbi:YqgE/AlgH family protein [Derxia lacustris]|uniref:YqgE/AlgH family protein n=1 Tax=Derxia lacustris TaxID=764842 RepID=UPI000A16F3DD|nr:YqgE/AlgH family protein [Derxia lacustris]